MRTFRYLAAFVLLLSPSVFLAGPALAVTGDYGQETAALQAELISKAGETPTVAGQQNIAGLIGVIIKAGLSFIGIIFFGLVLYAGFIWMRAMGNTEMVTKAKDILESAIIGLVLVMAAYAITNFVFDRLAGQKVAPSGGAGGGASQCETKFSGKNPTCIDTSACVSPKVASPGFCPGPANIQCCHDP